MVHTIFSLLSAYGTAQMQRCLSRVQVIKILKGVVPISLAGIHPVSFEMNTRE